MTFYFNSGNCIIPRLFSKVCLLHTVLTAYNNDPCNIPCYFSLSIINFSVIFILLLIICCWLCINLHRLIHVYEVYTFKVCYIILSMDLLECLYLSPCYFFYFYTCNVICNILVMSVLSGLYCRRGYLEASRQLAEEVEEST